MIIPAQCSAFIGAQCIASGPLADVAIAVKHELESDTGLMIQVFDDATGRPIDLDLRGPDDEVRARFTPAPSTAERPAPAATTRARRTSAARPVKAAEATPAVASPEPTAAPAARGRGRPKLGVVAREITLLPRHWEWLAEQPGGASVALRKLVETARSTHAGRDEIRRAQEATYRVMHALAGDRPGYEEALRALYAPDRAKFEAMIAEWPKDIREQVAKLSDLAFPTA